MSVLKRIALASAALLIASSSAFAAVEPTTDVAPAAPEASVVTTEAPATDAMATEAVSTATSDVAPASATPSDNIDAASFSRFRMGGESLKGDMKSDVMPRSFGSNMSDISSLLALGTGVIIIVGILVLALGIFYAYCQFAMAKKLDTPNAWMAFGWLIGLITAPGLAFVGGLLSGGNPAIAGILIAVGAIPLLLPNYLMVLMSGKGHGFAFLVTFVLPILATLVPVLLGQESGVAMMITGAIYIISAILGIYIFVLILNRRNRNGWMVLVLLFFYPIYFPILALRDVPPRI